MSTPTLPCVAAPRRTAPGRPTRALGVPALLSLPSAAAGGVARQSPHGAAVAGPQLDATVEQDCGSRSSSSSCGGVCCVVVAAGEVQRIGNRLDNSCGGMVLGSIWACLDLDDRGALLRLLVACPCVWWFLPACISARATGASGQWPRTWRWRLPSAGGDRPGLVLV
jgi:hypothetical protein